MSADAASRVCEFVVKQIVDNPDGVSVAQSETDGGIRRDVSVAAGDMGRALRGDTCGPSGAQSNPKQSIVVLRKGREGSQNRREGKGREAGDVPKFPCSYSEPP